MRVSRSQLVELVSLVLLTTFFLLTTLPHLANFPALDWPQMGIAAPAWKLASEGVYGNDLFAGFHRSELRNFEYMPAYPLLVAAAFRGFGLGVLSARGVSVLCGWLTIMLTYLLGRRFWGPAVGLVAATWLVIVRLGLLSATSGIPLLDFARIIRYDILVPIPVLLATGSFLLALEASEPRRRKALLVLAGALAGIAGLAHVYGAFILIVFVALLAWQRGPRVVVEPCLYLLALGALVATLPWWIYVALDLDAYTGQMSRHVGRFELFDPSFFWQNLMREPGRFGPWLKGGFPETLMRPRVGIWLLLLGVPMAFLALLRRVRLGSERYADRFLLLSLPLLELCLALLIFMKRNVYTILLLPFLALWIGVATSEAWRASSRRRLRRTGLAIVAMLALFEGSLASARMIAEARSASPYLEVCRRIASEIPSGSRVLISQPYWLGLERQGDYQLRSINLVFLRAKALSVHEALDGLAPDYVVIENYFLEPGSNDPRGPPPDSDSKRTFLEIRDYLEKQCSTASSGLQDATYGTIEIYRCGH